MKARLADGDDDDAATLAGLGARDAEPGSRERILRAAGALMERRGYHGTGMAEIVKESGAPKGSVYFHFPGGKEQIAAEAVLRAGLATSEWIRQGLGHKASLGEDLGGFIDGIAFQVEDSGFRSGGPLLIVAAETATDSETINRACREAYGRMRAAFVERLSQARALKSEADSLATAIMAFIEGGIVLSRTFHSGDPLRMVAAQVRILLDRSVRRRGTRGETVGAAAHTSVAALNGGRSAS